ncbi:hypothetical protein Bbelb_343600 [Branchiostoma belcheri]|nr:hypothetical protein Bbelb_343600 [Branchiostoma belcheri]
MKLTVNYGELCQGKRDRGAPRKRFKDQLKRQLIAAGIPVKEWESVASDRSAWRAATREGAVKWEKARKEVAEQRGGDERLQPLSRQQQTCRSRIGLHSHMKACSHMKD